MLSRDLRPSMDLNTLALFKFQHFRLWFDIETRQEHLWTQLLKLVTNKFRKGTNEFNNKIDTTIAIFIQKQMNHSLTEIFIQIVCAFDMEK